MNKPNQNKPKQTCRYREQNVGYQREGRGEGKMSKGVQLYYENKIFGGEHVVVYIKVER